MRNPLNIHIVYNFLSRLHIHTVHVLYINKKKKVKTVLYTVTQLHICGSHEQEHCVLALNEMYNEVCVQLIVFTCANNFIHSVHMLYIAEFHIT